MNELNTFVSWLSHHPSVQEVTRALVLDYLAKYGACCARISLLNSDDSLTFVSEYGFEDGFAGQTFPASQWRTWREDASKVALGISPEIWSNDKQVARIQLRDRGAVQGHLTLRFSSSVPDVKLVEEIISEYSIPLSLYLSFINPMTEKIKVDSDSQKNDSNQLTPRQLAILRGMVEGKTNHELATELGFSVSTVRHETMRVYQALAVSDRKEAAKKAIALALL